MNQQTAGEGHARVSPRFLERHDRLRLACALLWCSFLGATLSMVTLQLTPRDWMLPPTTMEEAGPIFLVLWVLAFVPTLLAATLFQSRKTED